MNNIRWEDLVFANRNQAYGAYPLRRTYPGRVSMSFAFAMAFVALMLCYPIIKSLLEVEVNTKPVVKDPDGIICMLPPPPFEPIITPPPPVHTPVKPPTLVAPTVTSQDVTDLPPTIDDLRNVEPSDQNANGASLGIETTVAVEPPPPADDIEKVWLNPQEQPEFPGGIAEMMKFIGKHIRYPGVARRQNISGSVFISFVVNADGTIGNIETLKGIHPECDNEAMRVIGKMPTWKPGKQNGKAVKVRLVLPIKFALTGV